MDYQQVIKDHQNDFDKAFAYATQESNAIRTGRANPDMVADLKVDYHGTEVRLKEIAAITTPEPRSLLIQPWDKAALSEIEKAIRESSIGLNPVVDGNGVRLQVPALTEERRKEYVRVLHQKMEDARIKVRHIREEVLKKFKAAEKDKELREDDARRAKEELQKSVDATNEKIEALMTHKEKELMTA